ncbi:CmpA/NrtA family ABC transporter substrate-binding protein [Aurantimonas sp. HBX-1]|uniref:CmpA/NrtA family ABC transporter substrate-binding protein n=1 Tax=Aurantimonas sp. HBX-1 TaxID=2906072 RepID=UPI001F3A32D7|nr:CmpA/NrtA family ABC transporter substrate-binding protein [Aurantimonas sp. HBX-1]UIJ72230.1 ABC transporter substrate-binding protein [Aurantimonas sp. HBX-1]
MADIDPPRPSAPPLPAPALGHREATSVRTGFIPLMDAAVLFAAEELGFARREGLSLDLVRDVSWSNIRDRLAFRQFDAAHLLAPMAVAAQVGIGTNPFPVIAPMALGRGGNAITLSRSLAEAMDACRGPGEGDGALAEAGRLGRVVAERQARGLAPLVFGVVYPFSSHNYEFRFWLACGGIDPDRDVTMTVVPPPMTADALAANAIDGFCVNAPWNVVSVRADVGRIVAVKADIWPASPEKVLGLRPDWAEANADTVARLLVALDAAARWCDEPGNHPALAEILAAPRFIGGDAAMLRRILDGDVPVQASPARTRHIDDYLVFHRAGAGVPSRRQALWVYSQMLRWGQVAPSEANRLAAASAFRPDLYASAIGDPAAIKAGTDPDGTDAPLMDGRVFDPEAIEAYVAGFPIGAGRAHPGSAATD